jgi:hypothetical protein
MDGADDGTPVERVVAVVREWPGVSLAGHPYDGVEFRLDDYEFGHAHYGWESVHVNYPRRMRDALIAEGRASEHTYFSDTGWTERAVDAPADVGAAVWLLRVSYLYRAATRRHNDAARTARESVDVDAELAELGVSDSEAAVFSDVPGLRA